MPNRPRSQAASGRLSRYPGGALANIVRGSAPAVASSLRRFDTNAHRLARGSGGGTSSQAALINESDDTGRLRLITSIAKTARCLAPANGRGAPLTLICNGPSTSNVRYMATTGLIVIERRGATIQNCHSPPPGPANPPPGVLLKSPTDGPPPVR